MQVNKKWVILFAVVFIVALIGIGLFTIIIDPYFHYHKPLSVLQYPISNQRYQNDGILKHFDYNAIIIGSSMTENFKASEFDRLFEVDSVKVPFSGATYKEINDNLKTAVNFNPNIKIILRCIDYTRMLDSADAMRYDADSYPSYLYDNLFYNDVRYILNKTILFEDTYPVIRYTLQGGVTTDFDKYSNWMKYHTFGKDSVDATYNREERTNVQTPLTDENIKNIIENITYNVTDLAEEHPEIEFYLFFPPYSIYYWDRLRQRGTLERQLEAERYAIELLVKYDNIHLFSFFTEYEMICDLNNYKDEGHYSEDINSKMLIWMSEGTHEITAENYNDYCTQMEDFYLNFNYDGLFQ